MLEAIANPFKFICFIRPEEKADPFEGTLVVGNDEPAPTPVPPGPPVPNQVAVVQLARVTAARPGALQRVGKTPEEEYQWSFQVAQESAKQGNEKAAAEALSKMRLSTYFSAIPPETHAQNERLVYTTLYEATLQSAKNEIEGHIGGGWHKVTRAQDPLIEKDFNRDTLFAKLDEHGSKAGISSEQIAEAKKGIDGALYDYYQNQAKECIAKFERGGDVDVDENFEKYISKMKEVGTGSGRSEAQVNEDTKKVYSILFLVKHIEMLDYISEEGATRAEFFSDPLYGPKMHELARKIGISEKMFKSYWRDFNFAMSNNPDPINPRYLRQIQKEDKRLKQEFGRTTTMRERFDILAKLPKLDSYKTYDQWRKLRDPNRDVEDWKHPDTEQYKAYNEWKGGRVQ